MAANTEPIFSKSGDVSSNAGTAMAPTIAIAVATYTGVDANDLLVFTADPTNGSYVERLRFKAAGTNIATVARIYFNNGADHTVATNNSFFGEISLPATTATATAATADLDYLLDVVLPAGFRIYVGVGTTVASGWVCTPVAGKY